MAWNFSTNRVLLGGMWRNSRAENRPPVALSGGRDSSMAGSDARKTSRPTAIQERLTSVQKKSNCGNCRESRIQIEHGALTMLVSVAVKRRTSKEVHAC